MIIREMTRQEIVELLTEIRFGRLACTKDNQPYVVPINFAYAEDHLYSFSMPGQKIDWMRANPRVCVQVDEFSSHREWRSAVIYGVYEELTDTPQWKRERDHAWSLLHDRPNWWEPGGLKPGPQPVVRDSTHVFYRILLNTLTGRQALEGDETPMIGSHAAHREKH